MKFKVIVTDNPWCYKNKKTGGSLKSGSVTKYSTLTYDELCKLPVNQIVDKNAIMFFWVPTPLKYEIAQSGIPEAWGFKEYKTTIYWEKLVSNGLGFWYRGAVEECWIFTRGKITPFRMQHSNIIKTYYTKHEWESELIASVPGKHSKKPKEFWSLVEPSLDKFELNPRLEMFAREHRDNYICIGNEVTGNDISVDLMELINYG